MVDIAFVVGTALSLAIAIFARQFGLDRDRAFYPTVLIVVASYYVLFAAMSGSVQVILVESLPMAGFVAAAVMGFRRSSWIMVVSLIGHGVFDALHGRVVDNRGMPMWWPSFCLAYDVGAGCWLAWLLQFAPPPFEQRGDIAWLSARVQR